MNHVARNQKFTRLGAFDCRLNRAALVGNARHRETLDRSRNPGAKAHDGRRQFRTAQNGDLGTHLASQDDSIGHSDMGFVGPRTNEDGVAGGGQLHRGHDIRGIAGSRFIDVPGHGMGGRHTTGNKKTQEEKRNQGPIHLHAPSGKGHSSRAPIR